MNAEFESLTCATKGCHALFALPTGLIERLRETGETFYCPFGHTQFFSDSKDEKIRKLKALVEVEKETRATVEAEADKLRTQIKRLKQATVPPKPKAAKR